MYLPYKSNTKYYKWVSKCADLTITVNLNSPESLEHISQKRKIFENNGTFSKDRMQYL